MLVNCNRRILSVNGGHHGYIPDTQKVLRHRVVLAHRDGLLPGVSSVSYTLYTDEDNDATVEITGATGMILEDDGRDCMRTVTVAQVEAMVSEIGEPDANLDVIRRRVDVDSDDGSDFDDVGLARSVRRQQLQ